MALAGRHYAVVSTLEDFSKGRQMRDIEACVVLLVSLALFGWLVSRAGCNRIPVLKVGIFYFQAVDGIRDYKVTGVQTCALPMSLNMEFSQQILQERGLRIGMTPI